MEDRRAQGNTFSQGIAVEDTEILPGEQGIGEHRGVPRVTAVDLEAQSRLQGVPMNAPLVVVETPVPSGPPVCIGETKKGNMCKAYSIEGSAFCVSHDKIYGS